MDGVIIFYFCSHHQTSQSQANVILRSFATQLLAANAELASYILDTFASQALRPTKKHLGVILEKLITSLSSVRIVVDGLDECAPSEQEGILEDLLRIKGPVPGACKILLSSRKLPSICKLLQAKPTLRLDDHAESVNSTIMSFVHQRLGPLRQNFDSVKIDELEGEIIAKANGTSAGAYFWHQPLILFRDVPLGETDNVYTRRSSFWIRHKRSYANTPRGLGSCVRTPAHGYMSLPSWYCPSYERILSRICGDSKSPNQRTATRILQWMLVARRPLKRLEIESGIILDDRVSQITAATRPRGDVLSSCYPIIDVEDGPCGYISFCHFTALESVPRLFVAPDSLHGLAKYRSQVSMDIL